MNDALKRNPALAGFSRDPMSNGPNLDGWETDAWLIDGESYCVRAWRLGSEEVFLGRGIKYQDAINTLRVRLGYPPRFL